MANSIVRRVGNLITNPAVLTGVGVAGLVSTSVLAFRAGHTIGKHTTIVNQDRMETDIPLMTVKDILISEWKEFIPVVVTGGVAITTIISAQKINSGRVAAIAGAYSLTETAFREYREKVVEQIGNTKEQKVRDEIAQDRVTANPPDANLIVFSDSSDTIMLDKLTGRYFTSNIEKVRRAQNDLNQEILNGMGYASQNDFYNLIGLPTIGMGDDLGWNVDALLDINFSAAIIPESGKPCVVIDYRFLPIKDYYKPYI